ncbi:DUF6544 family protein [Sphingobium yanoikuyae]|uniref:Uncharacterized protein n=1 Tax=Sphingobium yanoikuyae TaxID=13690 RepID=A0A9X7UEN1_SPHYA|nr:DUF6544 family protein [Sphingobium yanoikuyae]QNG48737.1 hypothetical protein H3V42_15205 [Sphingobium yanoikuyae]
MTKADEAYIRVAATPSPSPVRFDPAHVERLPEIARRYFRRAIAPGTALHTSVQLEMTGRFLLGDKEDLQSYRMAARQVLRAPDQFVWLPKLRSGPISIVGSDALVAGEAWTRFWLMGCQSASKRDPRSARKRDPLSRMVRRSRNAPCAARGVGRAEPDRRRAQRKAS